MSSSIWTQCGASSRLCHLSLQAWRIVEGQHRIATRKLVDSDAEHRVLEDLIEGKKPRLPRDVQAAGLHYLLSTPFRYPPLRYGSRFGARTERSLWYGSETLHTAFAESAYYRLYFLDGTKADIPARTVELSAFSALIASSRAIDLTAPPFDAHHDVIAHKTSYVETQRLGSAMRADGVEAFRFPSARDPQHGNNVALLTPSAFASTTIDNTQTWFCTTSRASVELKRKTFMSSTPTLRFERRDFEVDGRLPEPSA